MANQTVNGVPVEEILNIRKAQFELAERIAFRKVKGPEIAMVDPDPQWPAQFQAFESRIRAALEHSAPESQANPSPNSGENDDASKVSILAINHVGSTSVPNLPAKPVIDIDLVLSTTARSAESFYVPRLEAAGFQFLFREPEWHWHRFFAAPEPMSCNLHVFGPQCPEVERHRIFRDWLRTHDDDKELYAATKRESAALSREKGEDMEAYNSRKEGTILQIYKKAFTSLGYLSG